MNIADRSKYLCQNPITGVWMFQHRLETFFFEYLLSDTHPLGHITDYVIKIEFQMRGSPHALCFLWVKDAPKIDKYPDDAVCAYIDKYITIMIPSVTSENEHHIKLMDSLQIDTHSDYCHKNKSCHFGSKNHNISTTTWWSWQNCRNCKISTTDCTKCTYNSKCKIQVYTIPTRYQLRCWNIYGCLVDITKRA